MLHSKGGDGAAVTGATQRLLACASDAHWALVQLPSPLTMCSSLSPHPVQLELLSHPSSPLPSPCAAPSPSPSPPHQVEAMGKRAAGGHGLNPRASRSHAVVRLVVESRPADEGEAGGLVTAENATTHLLRSRVTGASFTVFEF